jgi:serine/threonine protein kinase
MSSRQPRDARKTEGSVQLQEIVDSVRHYDELLNLDLPVTIADPLQEDCPVIACSKGFTELTGYKVPEVVGRNCRFLLNGLPEDSINSEIRLKCREYVSNTMGQPLEPSDANLSEFKQSPRTPFSANDDDFVCVQTNATKSGELFKNMVYLTKMELNEKPFILGLQARLPEEWDANADPVTVDRLCQRAFACLSKNVAAVELVLAKRFWYSAAARRNYSACFTCFESDYLDTSVDSTSTSSSSDEPPAPAKLSRSAPQELHTGFDRATIQQFPHDRFELVRKIENASRNFGSVCLMRDLAHGNLVAMKQMPTSWIQTSHEAFTLAHPDETEQPWNDIGCNAFLDSVGYPYCVKLIGVFMDTQLTSVVTEFAAGGDMFRWSSELVERPGLLREVRVKPLAKQIGCGIQYLHELSIVHGDLSLENILLMPAADSDAGAHIKIIDFGAAVAGRFQKERETGKSQYQAPEMFHEEVQYDGFLSDAFSFGVVTYGLCLKEFPWRCTSGNDDRCFQCVKSKGFAFFVTKMKMRESPTTVGEVLSLELRALLEGLLNIDPSGRLTLGESVFGSSRRSIWNLTWTQ